MTMGRGLFARFVYTVSVVRVGFTRWGGKGFNFPINNKHFFVLICATRKTTANFRKKNQFFIPKIKTSIKMLSVKNLKKFRQIVSL